MLPTDYQKFIHLSRYSRWLENEGRRETWEETVKRYFDFFEKHLEENHNYILTNEERQEYENAVLNLEVMPSMRALMTAGKALERDHVAGYNCAYVAVNRLRSFDEILYILMCLHPDTKIVTINGPKKISDINPDTDLLLTKNEESGEYEWEQPIEVLQVRIGAEEEIFDLEFEDGTTIRCTGDHKFLTSNRGWVEAKDLTEEDDLETPDYIYKSESGSTKGVSSWGTSIKSQTQ